MVKFLAAGDVHLADKMILGRPRLPVVMKFLAELVKMAQIKKAKWIFFLGDLIDQKKGTPRSVLVTLYHFLRTVKEETGITVVWIRGNHETPDKENPQDTLMTLFADVCLSVIEEQVLRAKGVTFFLLPWFPENEFIKRAEGLARQVLREKQPCVLLSHVGVKEGRLSASNVPEEKDVRYVSINHLHPDLYDIVLLGDYHAHQQVADNAWYTGAPMKHNHGDHDCFGPMLVEIGDTVTAEILTMPSRCPDFCQWRIVEESGLALPGYDPNDYNRIESTPDLYERARVRYPGADHLMLFVPPKINTTELRLTKEDFEDLPVLLEKWLKYQGVEENEYDKLKAMGMTCLAEAVHL